MLFNFNFSKDILILLFCILIYIVFELGIRYKKNSIKRKYRERKGTIHSGGEAEQVSLEHFNKLQSLDITRIAAILLLIVIIFSFANVTSFSFLAVALGAIIITLRDYVLSLISYVYVLANFDIGDDIKIGQVLGSIVRIRPLMVSIAGKNSYGDLDGALYHIPNSKFISEIVERQEIKDHNYKCVSLEVIYSNELFEDMFSVWLKNLKKHLDDIFTKRSLKDVGNYKTYAGIKYKLFYNYNEDGDIVVNISFITRIKNAATKKEEIIEYVESTRRLRTERTNKSV